jgi:hypothetical protein
MYQIRKNVITRKQINFVENPNYMQKYKKNLHFSQRKSIERRKIWENRFSNTKKTPANV